MDPKKPAVDQSLIDHLSRVFPDKLPTDAAFSERAVACSIGHQQVITHLRFLAKDQSETVL